MPFHEGRRNNGKHYWLTPPDLMAALQKEFGFDHDACPFPKPEGYDGLTAEWGNVTYVNPPFGSIMVDGKKKGPTAWARKALAEHAKGKTVVLVFPTDKWIHYLLKAGAELRSLGDVRWTATEDGTPAPSGIGRFTMAFILRGEKQIPVLEQLPEMLGDGPFHTPGCTFPCPACQPSARTSEAEKA